MVRALVIVCLAAALAGVWFSLRGSNADALEPGGSRRAQHARPDARLVGGTERAPAARGGPADRASNPSAPGASTSRLTDVATGEPLPHFLMEWTKVGSPPVSITTDDEGAFSTDALSVGHWSVRYVDLAALRAARAECVEDVSHDGGPLALSTVAGPTFDVLVDLPTTLPASALTLTLANANPFSSQADEATTAPLRATGGRVWCRLPPIEHVFERGPFNASLDDDADRWASGIRYVGETTGRAQEPLHFSLHGLGGIDLGAFGPDGSPLAITALELDRVTPSQPTPNELPRETAVLVRKGERWLYSRVRVGQYEVLVRTGTCEHERFPLQVRQGEVSALDVRPTPLPARASISGVAHTGGAPLPEFPLLIRSIERPERTYTTPVDPVYNAGRFHDEVPAGRYSVTPLTASFLRWTPASLDVDTPATDLSFQLADPGPRYVAWFTVVDAETGAPLHGASIRAQGADGAHRILRTDTAGLAGLSLYSVSRATFSAAAPGYVDSEFDETVLTLDKSGDKPVLRTEVRLARE